MEFKPVSRQISKLLTIFFTLNSNLFLSRFLFVRAPAQDSTRSTYSFVHMLTAMLAAIDHCGNTILSGAGGPYTWRSQCPEAWTIDCQSWPVPVLASGSGGRALELVLGGTVGLQPDAKGARNDPPDL